MKREASTVHLQNIRHREILATGRGYLEIRLGSYIKFPEYKESPDQLGIIFCVLGCPDQILLACLGQILLSI